MPAAAIFLARGGVLSADHRRPANLPARYADVAADADTHVVDPALLDLPGQKWIRNRRPGSADDVRDPLGHDLGHLFRIGETPHAQHGFARHLLDELGPGNLVSLLIKARGPGILTPFGDISAIDAPQADNLVGHP